jgi:hypothetical protein
VRTHGRSSCRPHPCSSRHAALVSGYHAARQAWELQAEAVALDTPGRDGGRGEGEDLRAFRAEVPAPTFRDWLLGLREQVDA